MAVSPSDPGSNWYSQPGALLDELHRGSHTLRRGPLIDGYEDIRTIRRGGQGEVFSAFHRPTKRRVAIKVLLDRAYAAQAGQLRFEREIDLVAGLQHRNIVRLYDRGLTSDGRQFFSMEYVDGLPLGEYLATRIEQRPAGRGLPADDLLRLFCRICSAVGFAHQKGIIHRDLKPANILIDAEGEPHILDFGLAKVTDSSAGGESPEVTRTGEFMGTLAYSSPEQLSGDPSQTDTRTDVYALGVVLYEMLTGGHPIRVTTPMADLIKAITETEPQPPSIRARDPQAGVAPPRPPAAGLNDEIDTIVLKALAKQPDRRYQSVQALREDVQRYFANEPLEAKRDSRWYVLRKTLRRHRGAVTAAACFALLLLGFGITMSVLYHRTVQAEARAQQQAQIAGQQAQVADRQAVKASMVSGFLEQMLGSVDPARQGRDVLVRDVLDQAVLQLETNLSEQPEVKAALHTSIGNAYRSLGLYDEAEAQLRTAMTIRQALGNDQDLDYAASLSNLAAVQASRAEYAEAIDLYDEALEIYRQYVADDDPLLALCLNNLGAVLVQAGQPEAAEPLYRQALEINRRRFGDVPHPDLALSIIHLAGLSYVRGDFPESERLYRQALDVYRTLFGNEHPVVAYCLSNIALALQGAGDFEAAEQLHREVIDLRRRLFGEEHPDLAISLYYLAHLLHVTGRPEEAQDPCRRALELQRRLLPESHPDTARTLLLLSKIMLELSDSAGAEAAVREARAILADAYPERPLTVTRFTDFHHAWTRPTQPDEFHAQLPAAQ